MPEYSTCWTTKTLLQLPVQGHGRGNRPVQEAQRPFTQSDQPNVQKDSKDVPDAVERQQGRGGILLSVEFDHFLYIQVLPHKDRKYKDYSDIPNLSSKRFIISINFSGR